MPCCAEFESLSETSRLMSEMVEQSGDDCVALFHRCGCGHAASEQVTTVTDTVGYPVPTKCLSLESPPQSQPHRLTPSHLKQPPLRTLFSHPSPNPTLLPCSQSTKVDTSLKIAHQSNPCQLMTRPRFPTHHYQDLNMHSTGVTEQSAQRSYLIESYSVVVFAWAIIG